MWNDTKKIGVPACLKDVQLTENSTTFLRKKNVLVQAWKTKKKMLYMISTVYRATIVDVDTRRNRRTTKPICVIDYNKYMKGVDRADQYLSYYSTFRKTKKCSKKAVLFFINSALFNVYQIYKKASGSTITFKKFLLAVVRELLGSTYETNEPDTTEPGKSNIPVLFISSTNSNSEIGISTSYTERVAKHDPPGRLCEDMKKH